MFHCCKIPSCLYRIRSCKHNSAHSSKWKGLITRDITQISPWWMLWSSVTKWANLMFKNRSYRLQSAAAIAAQKFEVGFVYTGVYFHTYWHRTSIKWWNYFVYHFIIYTANGVKFIIITVTSTWARWCLKSPAYRLLLNRLFGRRSKKASKHCVTGLCEGNSPVTGEFPAQRASDSENVSIDDVIMCHIFLMRCYSWKECNRIWKWLEFVS